MGILAWVANLQYLTSFFANNDGKSSQALHVFAMGDGAALWHAAFLALYPFEVFCLIAAISMIKGHLMAFYLQSRSYRKLAIISKITTKLSVFCGLVGSLVNLLAANWRVQLVYRSSEVVSAIAKNESTFIIMQQFSDTATAITRSSSVQLFTEAFILVLNIFIFILIVNATIHRIQDLMFVSPVGGAANRFSEVTVNQMKLLRAMVLLLLSPRALYTAFLATTGVLYDATCLGICNSSCMDQLSLLRNWLEFSPEFRVLVVGVSSTLLMLIFIWITNRAVAQQRYRRFISPLYVPSRGYHSQLLMPDHVSPLLSRSHYPERATQLTPAHLDASSSTFLHSKEPTTGEVSRCRLHCAPRVCSQLLS